LVEQVKTQPIDAERIERAKTLMKVSRVKSIQTAEDICASLADDFMSTGDPHFSDKYVERIEAVTAQQLQDVAQKYLVRGRLLTTVMLPEDATNGGLAKATDLIRPPAATAAIVGQAGITQRSELDNGVILLVKRIPTSPLVVMQMYSLGGVTMEDEKTNGLGNLAMEMLSRGSQSRNAEQIAEFFDSIGGELECACGNNSWYWNASCLTSDFEKTLAAYADVVNHPSFPEAELGPMKERIEAAIVGEDADWSAAAFRFFKQEFFGPMNSPYRFMAIGTKENVDRFTIEQIRQWYAQKVMAGRRVLAIYGDVDPEQAKTLAAKYLGSGPKVGEAAAAPGPFSDVTGGAATPSVNVAEVKVQANQQALAGIVIGFKSQSIIGDPTNYILDVGQTMAGGWGYPTGYLFETLRGKGLVYDVEDQNNPGRSAATPGTFFVFAGCDPAKVNDVVDQILLNIARLQGTAADMQEDWFKRSKLLITTADALDNETPAAQAATAALDELFGLGYDYHRQFADRINGVTLDQIRQTAAARLRECVVTICTPDPSSVHVATGVRSFGSFPTVDLTPRGVQHDTSVAKP
jgi:zinc protease